MKGGQQSVSVIWCARTGGESSISVLQATRRYAYQRRGRSLWNADPVERIRLPRGTAGAGGLRSDRVDKRERGVGSGPSPVSAAGSLRPGPPRGREEGDEVARRAFWPSGPAMLRPWAPLSSANSTVVLLAGPVVHFRRGGGLRREAHSLRPSPTAPRLCGRVCVAPIAPPPRSP